MNGGGLVIFRPEGGGRPPSPPIKKNPDFIMLYMTKIGPKSRKSLILRYVSGFNGFRLT